MHQRAEKYGFGRCMDEFTQAERNGMDGTHKNLMALSRRHSGAIGNISKLVLIGVRGAAPGPVAVGHADPAPVDKETGDENVIMYLIIQSYLVI